MGSVTLGEIAVRFGLTLKGDPNERVHEVATLKSARAGALAFLANPHYKSQARTTHASAVIVKEADADEGDRNWLIAPDPYVAYAKVAAWLTPKPTAPPGIHPSAVVDPSAIIAASASIGPLAYVGPNAVLGERVVVDAGAMIHGHCSIGADCRIGSKVALYPNVTMGERCLIHAGAVLGADGFGLAMDRDHWIKVPQVGGVRLGCDVEVGANTTIDRGAIEDTIIEDDVRLDNQIQIGHNVRVGAHTAIAGCVGISGSTEIGQYCMIAGFVGIAGHLKIADRVVVLGYSLVSHSIESPGVYSSGVPAQEARKWRRTVGRLRQLDDMHARLKRLERTSAE